MNYSKFCRYEVPLSSLTKKEIEKPYLVLEELCRKRNMEQFQMDLWIFHGTVFKERAWKAYDPCQLYKVYKDLIRLMDALWLIYKYSPGLSSLLKIKDFSELAAGNMADFNQIFPGIQEKKKLAEAKKKDIPCSFLHYFYSNHHTGFLKINLHCYLQAGLNASYMSNDKYEYFGLQQHDLVAQFEDLSDLVTEAYLIYEKGSGVFPNLEHCAETSFAIDRSHPTHVSSECMKNLSQIADSFYFFEFSMENMQKGLKAWERMLYANDFWKDAENPGNLIHLQRSLAKLIDCIWLMGKRGRLESIWIKQDTVQKRFKLMVKKCNKDERNNPLVVIRSFFAFKKIYEWKAQLEQWLECSLSNSEKYVIEDKSSTKKGFKYLLKFIEAGYLLNCCQTNEV